MLTIQPVLPISKDRHLYKEQDKKTVTRVQEGFKEILEEKIKEINK